MLDGSAMLLPRGARRLPYVLLLQLLLHGVGNRLCLHRSKAGGGGKDAVEALAAGEMAEGLQRRVELGIAAKAGRLHILILEHAVDGDLGLVVVGADVGAVAQVDAIGCIAALPHGKEFLVRPGAVDQLVGGTSARRSLGER